MKFDKEIDNFVKMSVSIGKRHDYAQGGGGNTSYKLDDNKMAVKASGFRLDQISQRTGYVVLDYTVIREFYKDISDAFDEETDRKSTVVTKQSIIEFDGIKQLRPSVEAGFHALLKRAVIHSHSAYASILCCSTQGRQIVDEIFKNEEPNHTFVPYVDPGFPLTVAVKNGVLRFESEHGRIPGIIFMENHGLIVCHDDHYECMKLHSRVNDSIREYFAIGSDYPDISINKTEEGFESDTKFIKDFGKIDIDYLYQKPLYPDQLVYINNNKSLFIEDNKILYKTNRSEAVTIEETLLAYLYAISKIEQNDLTLRIMPDEGVRFITGWESEAYRKKIAEKSD